MLPDARVSDSSQTGSSTPALVPATPTFMRPRDMPGSMLGGLLSAVTRGMGRSRSTDQDALITAVTQAAKQQDAARARSLDITTRSHSKMDDGSTSGGCIPSERETPTTELGMREAGPALGPSGKVAFADVKGNEGRMQVCTRQAGARALWRRGGTGSSGGVGMLPACSWAWQQAAVAVGCMRVVPCGTPRARCCSPALLLTPTRVAWCTAGAECG